MRVRPGFDAIAYATHEVRTCLHIIAGLAAMVEPAGLSSSDRESVHAIQVAAADAHRIIDDLVLSSEHDGAEPATVQWVISLQPWAPRCDIAAWLAAWRSLAAKAGTRIHLECAGEVPGVVVGDAPHVRQIVAALISNALKFAAGGNVWVHVSVGRTALGREYLALEVIDDGVGIEKGALERIFKPGERADKAVHKRFGGSGMGLAVGRELARALGGDIEVRSQPGHGAAFRLAVPLASGAAGCASDGRA